ncbi:MAG: MBL fold metallo-hydrolase [Opitutales bacterium]|nr:MBL fold metallo-hydrolase [Opitutales bacterium]
MSHTSRLTFLGAAGTVTGSRFLLETANRRFLIDCGLFQGPKRLRLKNWEPFPVSVADLDGILLTHAHIDHTGFLPRLRADGYEGPIWCTDATADLARILLPDTGHLQEEEARWANKRGYSKHHPAKPLFTRADAEATLPLLQPVAYGEHFRPADAFRAKYTDAGHILGSAILDLKSNLLGGPRKLVFSGDLGRPLDAVLRTPTQPYNVDYLVLESTYGNRLHAETDLLLDLARVVNEAMARDGVLVVPAFAVGRAQTLLFLLRTLEEDGLIEPVDIYLDSPMAQEALRVHRRHVADLNLRCRRLHLRGVDLFRPRNLRLSVSREDSIALHDIGKRAIIISASGMATGGRVLHHLAHRLPHPQHTILFIGFQAEGTRGRTIILEGRPHVKIHGQEVPIRAQIERIEGFSGHADYEEIMAWLLGFNRAPERVFLVHGQPEAAAELAHHIRKQFQWDVTVPEEGDHPLLNF